jgi:hypothetical protein
MLLYALCLKIARGYPLLIIVHAFSLFLSGRLEEAEEELVQLKIEREAERQRRAKYGTANGAAVETIASSTAEPPGETGEEGGGEVWEAGEDGETGKAPETTSQGKWYCHKSPFSAQVLSMRIM